MMLLMIVVFIIILLYISIYDFCCKRVPNFLAVVITILGFSYHYLLTGNTGLSSSFYGMIAGLLAALFFYRLVGLGAGDVKLIAAIGCFVGYPLILFVIAYSYVVSALLSLVYIKFWLPWYQHRTVASSVSKPQSWLKQRIPMAPGISLATFYVLYSSIL